MQATLDMEHHFIHEGSHFTAFAVVTNGASLSISFKTPSDIEVHVIHSINTESKAHIEILEDVTVTATSGTEVTIFNRNRSSNISSKLLQNKSGSFVANGKVLKDATITGGTAVDTYYTFTGKNVGMRRRDNNEFVCKKDTEYTIKLTSDDGNKGLYIQLDWYELTNLHE